MRNEPPAPTIGSQYVVNGRVMEVIHVDEEIVTLRDLERLHTISLTYERMAHEISLRSIVQFANSPGTGSKALAFTNPCDPAVISAQRKFSYVEAAIKQLGGTLPLKATIDLISHLGRSMCDPKPPSYSSLYAWTKEYKKHNCDRFCLLKDRSFLPRGKRLQPDVETVIHDLIKEYYLSPRRIGFKTLHSYIHAQITIINRRREGYSTVLLKAPSLSTVRRKVLNLCKITSDEIRHGRDYVKKAHHSSKCSEEPEECLDSAEIDSHLLKIDINDKDGNCLGRILWLTIILDIETRCVIGWELSATYPCAEKTIRALKKALIAVPGEEQIRGKPIFIHSDNGSEFDNSTIKYFLDRLNILFDRGPPYTPNARARVERFFGTFESWLHEQAGATNADLSLRMYYANEREATFTEESLGRHFEYWLERVYHQKKHRALNMPPAVAWQRAIKNHLLPEKFTEEDLDALCRIVRRANISAAGRVHFLSLSWYGPGLPEIRSNLRRGQKAICYFSPLNLGEIWVAHPDNPRNPERAYATQPEYQNGLTLTEHELLRRHFLEEGHEFDDSDADLALLLLRQSMAEEYEDSRSERRKRKRRTTPSTEPSRDADAPLISDLAGKGDVDDIPIFEGETL